MKPSPTDSRHPLFQLEYKRLTLLLLPTFLRQSRILAFLSALTAEVSDLHSQFIENQKANIKRIKHNGQVCYLQALLNDNLDKEARRITIDNDEQEGDWLIIYDETNSYQTLICSEPGTEIDPVHYIYGEAKIIRDTAYFGVTVPWTKTKENENLSQRLRALLNEYKLLSKKYNITFKPQ